MRTSKRKQRGWVTAAIGAAASLAGGLMANSGSKAESARNRGFQQDMYERRYQYAMNDMRAAGINPMLAGEVGGGSAPSGSQATISDPVTPAVNSALAARMNSEQLKQVKAQTDNVKSQTEVNEVEKIKKFQEAIQVNALTEATRAQQQNLLSSAGAAEAQQAQIGELIQKIRREIPNIEQDTRVKGATERLTNQHGAESISRQDLNNALTELRKLERNEYQAGSDFYGKLGEHSPAVKQLLEVLKVIGGFRKGN